jgi:pimeloyl-ACP methyl ester carboxylesterase
MANMVAETKRVSVEGAGHTVHLEQPEVWLRTVLGFMASGG